ncbi:hypothetical protein [Curtobacterium sp. 18060]|uniref:hypothetical protein n=1 Tax=Curtobacterium sp. 18060 TaxID=2681408 RepID=UPI00135A3347|nr:hypothetical protein [Curtobacterium sp. 18060]
MSAWAPTPAERRKYRDYTVEFRRAEHRHVHITTVDGHVGRAVALYYRIPSLKKFVVYDYPGTSDRERRQIEQWGLALPSGEWARFADVWERRQILGRVVFTQQIVTFADDPFAQLELELMIDADSEVSV